MSTPDIERLLALAVTKNADPFLSANAETDAADKLISLGTRPIFDPYLSKEVAALERRRVIWLMEQEKDKLDKEAEEIAARIRRERPILEDARAALTPPYILSRVSESRSRDFIRALKRDYVYRVNDDMENGNWLRAKSAVLDFHPLLINHDWSAAFRNAQDFDGGMVRLPFTVCAFELVMNWHPCVVYAGQKDADAEIECSLAIYANNKWAIFGQTFTVTNPGEGAQTFLAETIRAVCISLDADIAQATPIRAPHNGASRNSVPMPSISHHVVNLTARRVHSNVPPVTSGRSKRLHFRRGHYRHFPTFKVWVRWTLVGNPDLGYIEKEYRL